MPLTLTWNDATRLPVDGRPIRPDALRGLSAPEVARLGVRVGSAAAELGELFRVEGDAGDGHLVVEGDLRPVRDLGRGMADGLLTVQGAAGDGLGAEMAGGVVEAHGPVGDGAGLAMRGGRLHVRGPAGAGLGGAYPGARVGMREGIILVEGPVGDGAGLAMRRGTIAVLGPAGDGLGRGMVAGSIFAFGPVGRRLGAGMKRGTLALFGDLRPVLSPTFRFACRYRPPFVTLYLRHLLSLGFPVPEAALSGGFERYNGDLLDGGKGEVLVWDGG